MKSQCLLITLLLICSIDACHRPVQEAIAPAPTIPTSSYKSFVINALNTDLGFAMIDSLERDMAFVHGKKNTNGTLLSVNRIIYHTPAKGMVFNVKIDDNYLVEEFTVLTEDAAIRFRFDSYDFTNKQASLSIVDERTAKILLNKKSVTLNQNAIDNIQKAQSLGRDVATGGRLATFTNCEKYMNLTRVLLSVLGCITTYGPTFALIETALAAGVSGGLAIPAAILASAGTLIACYNASNDANNFTRGQCKEANDIPSSVRDCLISILTAYFSKDYEQTSGCINSLTDFFLEKASQQPIISQSSNGYSTGDPHLLTTDNYPYDFQGYGEFIAIKSTTDNFEVQVRQEDVKNTGLATLNTAVAVQTGNDVVCVTTMPDNVYVNGVAQGLSFSTIRLKNNASVVKTNSDGLLAFDIFTQNGDVVRVRFHNSYFLDYILYLQNNRKGKLIGLLGNFDGVADNDLQIRNGKIVKNEFSELYPQFADSWRIQSNQSLFYYQPGKTTESHTKRNFPLRNPILSLEAMQQAEALCRGAGISTEPHLNNCILDVGLLNDKSLISSAQLATQIDPRPSQPSITKFIADSIFSATYQVEGSNLVMELTGSSFFYSIICFDVNQNNQIDANLDRAYGTGVSQGNDRDVSFCPVYILDGKNFANPCGTASSSGSLSVRNFSHRYVIPLNEIDPTGTKKQLQIAIFMGDRSYPSYSENNYFKKPIILTIR